MSGKTVEALGGSKLATRDQGKADSPIKRSETLRRPVVPQSAQAVKQIYKRFQS